MSLKILLKFTKELLWYKRFILKILIAFILKNRDTLIYTNKNSNFLFI